MVGKIIYRLLKSINFNLYTMGEIKTLVGNPTKKPITISVDNLEEHPYHREMYDPIQEGYFSETFKRTNGETIHAPVVVINELKKMNRLKSNKLKTAI